MTFGTVRGNRRGLPKDLSKVNLKTGDVAYWRKGDVVALKWKDKRDVTLLTTIHDPREKVTVTTRSQVKEKPLAVNKYTEVMSGVDMNDQLTTGIPALGQTHTEMVEAALLAFLYLSCNPGPHPPQQVETEKRTTKAKTQPVCHGTGESHDCEVHESEAEGTTGCGKATATWKGISSSGKTLS
ncbi:PiggyBac transposable element-derived protein 4 [Plakobranchus ocellatus]|uniref:PiggyBac transposable element-derived protein 4 n=1 Tax=Plakobranchus ocellatus TaxID=259542 RepID=A0AAV4BFQ1_9GAST|nr:PiggyBac transposable element-derived protein 4 [Plakobranchus ocellatus]